MSIHIMALVWERAPYDGGTLLVLLALADWANEEGVTWPSMAQLAGKARMQIRNARYILRTLEADGMLAREQPGSGRATTVYRINLVALGQMPVAWKRPPTTPSIRSGEQNENAAEFAPRQNLHEAPHCRPGEHPIAALTGNDCRPGRHPIAALGGTPLPPTHHRSVIDPSGDPPTPAELGSDRSAQGGMREQKHGTPRELETHPRANGSNPRATGGNPRRLEKQARTDAITACPSCDHRGLLELRDEHDHLTLWRCPHDRDAMAAYVTPRGFQVVPRKHQEGPAP